MARPGKSNNSSDRLKVLFVYKARGDEKQAAPFILSQIDSLREAGIEIYSFPISGNSVLSYLSESVRLRKLLRQTDVDLIHAHYSLCAIPAVLATTGKPIVLSLMGSDILGEFISHGKPSLRSRMVTIITRLILPFANSLIVKSETIYQKVSRHKPVYLIPNGINLNQFKPIEKTIARNRLNLEQSKKYVLFLANPAHKWKNVGLANAAIALLNDTDVMMLAPFPVAHHEVVFYLNAADLMISTSFMEGSSNVIKEAMACNTPVVASDVGDASHITGGTEGCYITGFDPDDVAMKLKAAIEFALNRQKTNGRDRIIELGLDSKTVANKIHGVYKSALKLKS